VTHLLDWFMLQGRGYQFWSGFGSDFGEITLVFGVYLIWRRHVCHVKGCPRIIWKDHNGHALCRKHHPDSPPKAEDLTRKPSRPPRPDPPLSGPPRPRRPKDPERTF
jgi:hypothetical protein